MNSEFSRRKLFKSIAILVSGTVITGLFPFVNNIFTKKVQAQTTLDRVYKGRRYRIVTQSGQTENTVFDTSQQLFIDDRQIRIARHRQTNKYVTPLFFTEFNSPEDVAKTVIDLGLKLPSRPLKLAPSIEVK